MHCSQSIPVVVNDGVGEVDTLAVGVVVGVDEGVTERVVEREAVVRGIDCNT